MTVFKSKHNVKPMSEDHLQPMCWCIKRIKKSTTQADGGQALCVPCRRCLSARSLAAVVATPVGFQGADYYTYDVLTPLSRLAAPRARELRRPLALPPYRLSAGVGPPTHIGSDTL